MKQVLHINSDLTVLTSTQMSLIRGGGDSPDVNAGGSQEDGLPTLPTLPASTIPDYVEANNNGKHKGQNK